MSLREYFYNLATDKSNGILALCIKAALKVVSVIYAFGVRVVLLGYKKGILKKHKLNKKVISIGNITLGGTGKTPLVKFIAEQLKANNIHPVILIRGYMADGNESECSDEAKLLREELKGIPVLIGRDRVKSAQRIPENYSPDVYLLDDGFQHWRLFRDMDIVVVNSANPFGNENLIPRGILREPVSSLTRADMLVLSKVEPGEPRCSTVKNRIKALNPDCPIVETKYQPALLKDLRSDGNVISETLKGKNVCCICSIGDPQAFINTTKELGSNIISNFAFMDHYEYGPSDIEKINQSCLERKVKTIVTTHKDSVKLKPLIGHFDTSLQIFCLYVEVKITSGEIDFINRIMSFIRN